MHLYGADGYGECSDNFNISKTFVIRCIICILHSSSVTGGNILKGRRHNK
jgi:hypothetical protein